MKRTTFAVLLALLCLPAAAHAVSLTVWTRLTEQQVSPIFDAFKKLHPEIDLHIHTSDDPVDCASTWYWVMFVASRRRGSSPSRRGRQDGRLRPYRRMLQRLHRDFRMWHLSR